MKSAAEIGRRAVADPVAAVRPLLDQRGAGVFIPSVDPKTVALIEKSAGDLIVGLTDDLHRAVKSNVALAVHGAKSPWDAIEAIAGKLGTEDGTLAAQRKLRAEVIVRTELLGTVNMVHEDTLEGAARRVPDLFYKTWLHAPAQPNPRPRHARLHGKTIPALGKFRVGVYDASGPHDPALPAGERITCHCTLATRVRLPGEEI